MALLGIDNNFSSYDQYGKPGISSDMPEEPLYIGGHPSQKQNNPSSKYLGCIRNVEITKKISNVKLAFKKFPTTKVQGNVLLNACPTI